MTDEPLDPSGIAQFVEHDRCPRYIKQRVDPGEEPSAREWREAFGLMNIALLGHGREFEASQADALTTGATMVLGPADATLSNDGDTAIDTTWRDSARGRTAQLHGAIDTAAALPTDTDQQPFVFCYQVPLGGHVGDEPVWGEADGLALAPAGPADDADVVARVLDIKSATEEQVAHRVQVAIYSALLEQTLGEFTGVDHYSMHSERRQEFFDLVSDFHERRST